MREHDEGRDDWRPLLRQGLRVVDSLVGAGYGELDFRFGGGTVLMLRFGHRLSRDIDLFLDDAQALGFLSPRLNDTAAAVGESYVEQANSIKLVLPDGDIDFIVAGTVTGGGPEMLDFEGRQIPAEPTAEILAKKLLYRAATLKPRDVFDIATALVLDEVAAREAISATATMHEQVLRRLSTLGALAPVELLAGIKTTPEGHAFAERMVDVVAEAIRALGTRP